MITHLMHVNISEVTPCVVFISFNVRKDMNILHVFIAYKPLYLPEATVGKLNDVREAYCRS